MSNPAGSLVVLHIELGGEFLLAVLEHHGVQGWNRWMDSVCATVPGYWGEGENEPPLCFWFNLQGVNLSERSLDGLDLGLTWCEAARFDSSSLAGARLGCCRDASFRGCDLRHATFVGDVSGADFRDARLDGVTLTDATYDPECPPVGLPDDLLQCRPMPSGKPAGSGLTEYPVKIGASLAASSTCT